MIDEYLVFDNIIGYGFTRYKLVRGKIHVKDRVLVFFVKRKLPPHMLSKEELIPKKMNIGGQEYTTDVVEIVKPSTLVTPTATAAQRDRVRPVVAGVSAAAVDSTACTLTGPFMKDGLPVFITCSHCAGAIDFQCTVNGGIGKPVIQPSRIDGGKYPDDVIGTVSWNTTLASNIDIDLAVVIPSPDAQYLPIVYGLNIPFSGNYVSVSMKNIGDTIYKSGRTTGVTSGRIYAVNSTVKVSYGACGDSIVRDIVITTKMIETGDSGSPAVSLNGDFYGMFFATSDKYSFMIPAQRIVAMGITPIRMNVEDIWRGYIKV